MGFQDHHTHRELSNEILVNEIGVCDTVLEFSHGEGRNECKRVWDTKQNFRSRPSEQLLWQHLEAALLNLRCC